MNIYIAIAILLVLLIFLLVGAFLVLTGGKHQLQSLMQAAESGKLRRNPTSEQVDLVRRMTEATVGGAKKKRKETLELKLLKAGYFNEQDRVNYRKFQVRAFIGGVVVVPLLIYYLMPSMMGLILGIGLGFVIGMTLPTARLDKRIAKREDEILFFLPLTIEGLSIATSSGLDPGTAITNILDLVEMRGTHNAVTDFFLHVIRLVRSGLNLEDALVTVGEASAHKGVKQTFGVLAQCLRHGGEMSKQLQDLAESINMEKQAAIDAKIGALAVKATFPLAMVFFGFFIILVGALFTKLSGLFSYM